MAALTACGGGGSGAVPPFGNPPPQAKYSIGGTVTGLSGPGLVLEDLLGFPADDLAISSSGAFTFGVELASGAQYAINVKSQPLSPPQYCQVANDTGTVGTANVSNVQVSCGAGYTVGGTVSGLVGSGLVLQIANTQVPNDPSDPNLIGSPLPVKANGAFTLDSVYPASPAGFSNGDFVKIKQQPGSPTQRCLIENAAIRIQGANDTSVAVYCSEFAYVANAADNTLSAYRVDAMSGALLPVGTPVATGNSPNAVVGTYGRKFVYVANEGSNDISAFAVNVETGALTEVPGSPFAAGTGPSALALYANIDLYVANAGSNTISVFAIDATTGALTPLSPATYATGQGPSSLTVDPTSRFLYVANSGGSNDISAFVIASDGSGGLTPMAGSPFAAGANPLGLAFGASGKFLYTANTGGANPRISGFAVDSSGALTALSGSPFPAAVNHSIAADGTGAYLYATSGAGVLGYRIDATSGSLTSLPGFPLGATSYSVAFDPTNQFVYIANQGSATVSGFTFGASTGGLTPIAGSPFAAGNSPDSVTTL
jgi:6-phosphogluconolactonase (cycloisomerase 2 family)